MPAFSQHLSLFQCTLKVTVPVPQVLRAFAVQNCLEAEEMRG